MAGKKPDYRVVAKSKSSGKFQDIAAFWIGEKGLSGQLDKGIAKIVLTNGAVITSDTCWFNLQENKGGTATDNRTGSTRHEEGREREEDPDIPF